MIVLIEIVIFIRHPKEGHANLLTRLPQELILACTVDYIKNKLDVFLNKQNITINIDK